MVEKELMCQDTPITIDYRSEIQLEYRMIYRVGYELTLRINLYSFWKRHTFILRLKIHLS